MSGLPVATRRKLRRWLTQNAPKGSDGRRHVHGAQRRLAKRVGVYPPRVSEWLNGRRTPTLATASRLSKVTGIPAVEFLSPVLARFVK